jgi:hypothetical protein
MSLILDGTNGLSDVDGSAATPAIRGSDANTGVFFPAADVVGLSTGGAERVRVDASGNVGIGTSTPARRLDVSGAGVFNFTSGSIEIAEPGTVPGFVLQTSTANQRTDIRNTAGNLVFTTGTGSTTERMRIDSAGNVGIGTSSPAQKLSVGGNIVATGSIDCGTQFLGLSTDTATAPSFSFSGDTDTGVFRSGANVLNFSTGGTECARFLAAGSFLVGTTTNLGAGGISLAPFTSGFAVVNNNSAAASGFVFQSFRRSSTEIGFIDQNGTTAVRYSTTSDYRLKEDVAPMTGALAKVAQLKPCTYKWKADGSDGEGFIAHELQEICPAGVSGTKDAVDEEGNPRYQGIDTSFLVATLTAAIQEQQAIITALTARVEALEGAQA